MDDKRRKYGTVVSASCELLDRYPTHIQRIEEELVYRLTEPIIKEAIIGECIVRFTETGQRESFTTGVIEFHKSVCIEEIVRCKDCKYFGEMYSRTPEGNEWHYCGNAIVSGVLADDYCSYGERSDDERVHSANIR